jgi:hypothetical protein
MKTKLLLLVSVSCLSFLYFPRATLRVLEDFRTVQVVVARSVDREIVVKWPPYGFFRGTHSCKLITSLTADPSSTTARHWPIWSNSALESLLELARTRTIEEQSVNRHLRASGVERHGRTRNHFCDFLMHPEGESYEVTGTCDCVHSFGE